MSKPVTSEKMFSVLLGVIWIARSLSGLDISIEVNNETGGGELGDGGLALR